MTENTAGLGHNAAPDVEDIELLAEKVKELIAGANRMVEEIKEIQNPAQAQQVADFDKLQINPLLKRIETRRKAEVQPHLDAQRSINARHKQLTDFIEEARKAVNALLTPWLRRQQEEVDRRRREQEEAARKAQQEALQKQAEANSIEDRVAARQQQEEAERLAKEAAKPQRASVGSAYGARSSSLRTYYRGEITDLTAILAHYRKRQDRRLIEAVQRIVDEDIRHSVGLKSGAEKLPGVTVKSEQKAA